MANAKKSAGKPGKSKKVDDQNAKVKLAKTFKVKGLKVKTGKSNDLKQKVQKTADELEIPKNCVPLNKEFKLGKKKKKKVDANGHIKNAKQDEGENEGVGFKKKVQKTADELEIPKNCVPLNKESKLGRKKKKKVDANGHIKNAKQDEGENEGVGFKTKNKQPKKRARNGPSEDSDVDDIEDFEDNEGQSDIEDSKDDIKEDDLEAAESSEEEVEAHQAALHRLKHIDPEFYNFLRENDKKLLNFNVEKGSDDEEEADEADDEDLHQPSAELEIASDESDYEEDAPRSRRVTLKLIKQWQSDLQKEQKSNKTIIEVIKAFNAALASLTPQDYEQPLGIYKVEGSAVFNGIVQVCVLHLGPAIRSFLNLQGKQAPHRAKKFPKIKTNLGKYFSDLRRLLENVTSSNILNVILKHIHYMAPLLVSFGFVVKVLLRRLITIWGTGEESVRVVAFLCILRIANQQRMHLDYVLQTMTLTYVRNTKFVSVNTLPGINFMRRSLVEMYALDLNTAYRDVFLYIRQLAINLRNAMVDNKKENVQVCYNWQFVNSCRLWGNLLCQTADRQQLQGLIYPFIQVCLGALKLVPTAQYFPLRFHILQILMDLSRDTGVFIPILPFFTEVLTTFDFNKKHTKVSMKPLTFTTALRMGKAQMSENGFKDAIIEAVYAGLLEHLASHSHSVAFPDMVLFSKCQIKAFLKKCSVVKYTQKLRQLLEKIEQNSSFVETERAKLSVELADTKKIEAWEASLKNRGTPLANFHADWDKVRNIKRAKQATANAEIGEYGLPVLKKPKRSVEGPSRDDDGNVVLFPSDSEEEDDDTEDEQAKEKDVKQKRGKRAGKKAKKRVESDEEDDVVDQGDVVEDIVDW